MNANELITLIRETGVSSDDGVLATLKDSCAMGYIFGLPHFCQNDAKIVSAHYEAMRVIKTAYQIVTGDKK